MQIILLSGGSGKRLWPLSNDARSKQFLKLLVNDNGQYESMLQRVYRQIKQVIPNANVLIATGASQIDSIRGQLGDCVDVLTEPSRRNTYPAIALSVAYLAMQKHLSEDEPVLVMPVDPCTELSYFDILVQMKLAVDTNVADMVLMGIQPTYPSEKYGYILTDSVASKTNGTVIYSVKAFREKPTTADAAKLIQDGAFWNGGVFAFKIGYMMKLLRKTCTFQSFEELYGFYDHLKKISFDYEIVEKADSVAMIPFSGKWKDLGTWNTLTEEMGCNSIGTVVMGEGTEQTTVINETGLPVIVLGAKNMIVAASPDGILISDKETSSFLKPYAEDFSDRPMYEERRWGEYRVIDYTRYDDSIRSLTKHMYMKSGKSISYQLHHQRDEIWTIVHGSGELVLDGHTRNVKRGDIVYITAGQNHGMRAITDLHFIEVQTGMQLVEEDIERTEWTW
ncbi:MAG: sugar phosphate nucleotidyltransferase [Clostridia bacterium]